MPCTTNLGVFYFSSMPKRLPSIAKKRFNRWLVLYEVAPAGIHRVYLCKCRCGTIKPVSQDSLIGNRSKSCGCHKIEVARALSTKHGKHNTREYHNWYNIRSRCYNKNHDCYKYYGGRGIKICDHWLKSFENIYADIGQRPSPKHSIDRINGDLHYSCGHCQQCVKNNWPLNCRWATQVEQMNNTRNNRNITYCGKTLTLSQWARELKICSKTLELRLKCWSLEKAITTPTLKKYRH